jgi:hypothetical protein
MPWESKEASCERMLAVADQKAEVLPGMYVGFARNAMAVM